MFVVLRGGEYDGMQLDVPEDAWMLVVGQDHKGNVRVYSNDEDYKNHRPLRFTGYLLRDGEFEAEFHGGPVAEDN